MENEEWGEFITAQPTDDGVEIRARVFTDIEYEDWIERIKKSRDILGYGFEVSKMGRVNLGTVQGIDDFFLNVTKIEEAIKVMTKHRDDEISDMFRNFMDTRYQTSKERLDDLWEKRKADLVKKGVEEGVLEEEMTKWFGDKNEFEFMWLENNYNDMTVEQKREVERKAILCLKELNVQYHLHGEYDPTPERIVAVENAMVGYKIGWHGCYEHVLEIANKQVEEEVAELEKELKIEVEELKRINAEAEAEAEIECEIESGNIPLKKKTLWQRFKGLFRRRRKLDEE